MQDDPWLKHAPASDYLDVGEKFLYTEGNAGRVRRIKVAGGYRYRQSWLDAYLVLLDQEQNGEIGRAAIRRVR